MVIPSPAVMRAGLIELLTADPGIQRLAPDVVFMEVRMPDLDGITATRGTGLPTI